MSTLESLAGAGGPPEHVLIEGMTRAHNDIFDAVTTLLVAVMEGVVDEVRLTKSVQGSPAVQVVMTSIVGQQAFQYSIPNHGATFMEVFATAARMVHEEIEAKAKGDSQEPWMQEYAKRRADLNALRAKMAGRRRPGGLIVPGQS